MENKEDLVKKIMVDKWDKIKCLIPFMSEYLYNKEILEGYSAEDVLKVMSECLNMLFGELNNKLGELNKYEPKHYTDSDFVDMVIESIGEDMPDKNDRKATLKYVEDFRVTLWGHTNYYASKYLRLYIDTMDGKSKDKNANEFIDVLKECMTIVMVECLLRITERKVENL